MSGICGVVRFDGRPAGEAELHRMVAAGRHRGPAGISLWSRDACAVAHLASYTSRGGPREEQPASDRDGRYLLVADARLDNREELLAALRARGRPVEPSLPDAALLLEGYMEWGEGCCARLIGDYAFVVWDRVEDRLFAARDPMGMRPLYYAVDAHRCYFASEVGQILAAGRISRGLHRPMVAAWLAGRAGDPGWTFFDQVRQVPGAHALRASRGENVVDRVWDVDPERRLVYPTDDDYAAHFRELLLEATRCRLRGDHRVGMLLSGGLDSCAVAAAAGWITNREDRDSARSPITTFAYRYEGFPECDERHVSGPLAEHWGMEIREVSSELWPRNFLLRADWGIDSPAVGIYRPLQDAAMGLARESGIRQLLIAARGDNMMGGGVWDIAGLLVSGAPLEALRELRAYHRAFGTGPWRSVRRSLVRPWRLALPSRVRAVAGGGRRAGREARRGERRDALRRAHPWIHRDLLEDVPLDPARRDGSGGSASSLAVRERMRTIFDRFTELGYAQNERHTALHGLRYDDPWSDRRILEFVAAVPQFVLNRVGDPKRLTRRALGGMVPPEVQAGARKIIPAPFGRHALREREGDALATLTSEMRAARSGLVDQEVLAARVRRFLDGSDPSCSFWPAVTLEGWMRSNDLHT